MFYGMYNVGHQANEILALADFDPSQHGELYLLNIIVGLIQIA